MIGRLLTGKAAITLVLLWLFLEFINFGALPFALSSIKAKSIAADATIAREKADAARVREQAIADIETESARTKADQAKHAQRFRQAEARTVAEQARARREIATNTPEAKEAETQIARMQATIHAAQEAYEARRLKAAIDVKRAQQIALDADARLKRGKQRAEQIIRRVDAAMNCINEDIAREDNRSRNITTYGLRTDRSAEQRHYKRVCLSQE